MSIFNISMLRRYIETKNNEFFDRELANNVIKDIELPEYKFSWRDLFWVSSSDNIYNNDGTK